jgi:hypothetical protein
MNLPRSTLLALCIVPLFAAGAVAQQDNRWGDKPVDLKVLVPPLPPVVPLPRDYQFNPGAVGGTQSPYNTGPFQTPSSSQIQSAPGIRLSIPNR